MPNSRLLQQIRRTQEQQQAQLKYLYDGMMQLARAANMNFGNPPGGFGGVLPVGDFGAGTGSNCFPAIGFDANGNPVIGVNEAGTALGVVGFNELGYPILAETTLVTPVNNGSGGTTTDRNGDGIPDADSDGDGTLDDLNGDGISDQDRDGDGFPPQSPPGAGQPPQQPENPGSGEIRPPPGGGTPPAIPFRSTNRAPRTPRTPTPQPRTGQ
jgi:hypothetical protein